MAHTDFFKYNVTMRCELSCKCRKRELASCRLDQKMLQASAQGRRALAAMTPCAPVSHADSRGALGRPMQFIWNLDIEVWRNEGGGGTGQFPKTLNHN